MIMLITDPCSGLDLSEPVDVFCDWIDEFEGESIWPS